MKRNKLFSYGLTVLTASAALACAVAASKGTGQ